MASAERPPPRATWTMADLCPFSPCCPLPPLRCPAWHCCCLSESMKGLLVALFGGGVPAGFVAPFARKAEASGIPSLEILLFRCILHLLFICRICWQRAHCCGPPEARRHALLHASINVISVGCAYSSFMVVPSGNATTVRKGSSTICSVLLALCIENTRLTGYDWFGLAGSTVGLLIMVIPDLMNLDRSTLLHDSLGYVWACMGGMSLALGLIIFRALDFPGKLVTAAFLFGGVGSLLCSPMMFLLQDPVMPVDPLTWTSLVVICVLALVSFLCSSYAVTKAHPALVCAVLHSEVVVTLAVQYCVLREAVTPFAVIGAGVILGSIAIITAQKISSDAPEDGEGVM
ncbi:solute carrier family 35 member G6 [Eublepharis macularius]|uniref:Solute carrier family 35 member G6 n=1 Tax=Eublepharis macularius TaxID=481883 RepID=A0AA97K5P0_EUBMA|nr:solute carrier family 35 member G6 [Eublepharis macularius]